MSMPQTRDEPPDFLDGQVLKAAQFSGLIIGEVEYDSSYERPRHVHGRACFHFLFQGGYTETHDGQSSECGPLMLSFQPAGHEHSYRSLPCPSRTLTIELDDQWISRLRNHSLNLDTPGYFSGPLERWLMMRLYDEFRRLDPCSPLVIEALTVEVAAAIARQQNNHAQGQAPRWLRQATDLLHDRFAESLSLSDVAASVGVHPVHLARVFRREYCCTVGEYLRRVRIDYASKQMILSDSSMIEIALAAGFSDQSQFSHAFKRVMGLTPGKFRAQVRRR